MAKLEFKKKNWHEKTVDEVVAEKRDSSIALFETEKIAIQNFRVENLQRLKKLNEIAELPNKNAHHRYITHNAFNAFSWIDFFCEKFESFNECFITSYNFSEPVIKILFEKFDAKVFQKLYLIISESIRYRMPARYFQLEKGIQERANKNLKLAGIWNHSKIVLLQPKNTDDFFIIEGSGNFSENAYIEQYSVDNSKQIYDFHKNWMSKYVFDPNNIEKKRHWIM